MCKVLDTLHVTKVFILNTRPKNTCSMYKVLNTLHMQEVFLLNWIASEILVAHGKYWILCTCKKYFKLDSFKNISCTCKVFNTLHLNIRGSIYPTLKKYILNVQSIQYFAPEYLGVHISNFEKILLARANYSILYTYIPGGPYLQLGKILLARAKYSILCT